MAALCRRNDFCVSVGGNSVKTDLNVACNTHSFCKLFLCVELSPESKRNDRRSAAQVRDSFVLIHRASWHLREMTN